MAKDVAWARNCMWAPDVQEKDGKYYLFFSANDAYPVNLEGGDLTPQKETGHQKYGGIGVAVADKPEGPYRGQLLGRQEPVATGAGHHSVLNVKGTDDWYICYHLRPIPNKGPGDRHVCLERMNFDDMGNILPIAMTEVNRRK